jgi:hypothetical protein
MGAKWSSASVQIFGFCRSHAGLWAPLLLRFSTFSKVLSFNVNSQSGISGKKARNRRNLAKEKEKKPRNE